MEALRYLPWLSRDGVVITSSKPFVNIPDYPAEEALESALASLPHLVRADIETLAKQAGNPKGANMVLLGMAASHIGIVSTGDLREALGRIFARKGDAVVEANRQCFDLGLAAAR